MDIQRLTHMGICVSDIERSLRFYRDVLGCVEVGRLELEDEPTATLNGMWPRSMRALRDALSGLDEDAYEVGS